MHMDMDMHLHMHAGLHMTCTRLVLKLAIQAPLVQNRFDRVLRLLPTKP